MVWVWCNKTNRLPSLEQERCRWRWTLLSTLLWSIHNCKSQLVFLQTSIKERRKSTDSKKWTNITVAEYLAGGSEVRIQKKKKWIRWTQIVTHCKVVHLSRVWCTWQEVKNLDETSIVLYRICLHFKQTERCSLRV